MPIKPVNAVIRDRRRIVWAVAALISFVALARCASAQAVTVPADTTQEVTHEVKKGDTLWDIARTYLKNPSCSPPSTGMTWPVVLDSRSVTSNRIASA